MGGIQVEAAPPPSREEIIARLIEIGRTPIPKVHTVWVVEDPPISGMWPYRDRPRLDMICYHIPAGHLEKFPFSKFRLENSNITFYRYEHEEYAKADAKSRLEKYEAEENNEKESF
jgi:hypothetical protein